MIGHLSSRFVQKGSFAAHVLTLMTGTTIAQLISFACAPILTRLYRPYEFGIFALFVGIGALFSVVSTGRYEYAIVLPDENEDAINLLVLSFLLVVLTSLLCGIGVTVYLVFSQAPNIMNLWLVPIYVLFTGTYQTLNLWNNRLKRFDLLSFSRVILSVCTVLVSIFLGYWSFKLNGLFVGAVVGQAMASISLGWWTIRDGRISWQQIHSAAIYRLAKRYVNFPKINVAHALVDNFNSSGTIFLVTYFFGASIVGYYSFMMRILQAPAGMISASLGQVFYQRASETYAAGGDVYALVMKLLKRLLIMAFLPMLIIMIAGPSLFGLLFGEKWVLSGEYAQALTPYMYLYFVVSPLTLIPFIFSKQKESFFISASGNVLFIVCMAIAGSMNNMYFGLISVSIVVSSYFIFYIRWILSFARSNKAAV